MSGAAASGAPGLGRVFALALPVILSNISIPLMGAVDTAVMGHLPDPAYIGGVALGGIVFAYVYWGFGSLRMATTGFTAQARGAGDDQELRHVTLRSALMALGIGAVIIALQLPICEIALAIAEGSARVKTLARDYVLVRIWSAPATLSLYVIMGWLIGMQRMRTVLALTVFQNGLNAVLALLFVVGFGWGVEGVAGATVLAEYAALAAGGTVLWSVHRRLGGHWGGPGFLDRKKLLGTVRVNGDIFLRTLFLVTGFAWFTSQSAGQGDVVLAANMVLTTFLGIAAYGLDGFAHAAETLVGSAIGAREREVFRVTVRLTTVCAAIVALAAALVIMAIGPLLIDAITVIEPVRAAAREFLPWAAAYPALAVWCFQLDGIYIGATRTAEMRNGMAVSLAVLLGAGYALMPSFGNHGLWAAFDLFAASRGAVLALWYPRILAQFEKPA